MADSLNNQHHHAQSQCGCCGSRLCSSQVSRRGFLVGMGAAAGGLTLSALSAKAAVSMDPVRFDTTRKSLRVQPVLVCSVAKRREGTSWRNWGGLHTEKDVSNEKKRIGEELAEMKQDADFPMEILPLLTAREPGEASKIAVGNHDVLLMYAAGSRVETLEALTNPDKWTIVFLRHRSGPVYLWYEIISNRYLRKTVDEFGQPGVTTRDVVVDRYDEMLWRLRALVGLKNTLKKKVVCIGGASGWGVGGKAAPKLTQDTFGMELINVDYKELDQRIMVASENKSLVNWCKDEAKKYLDHDGVTLYTDKAFVEKCFLLTEVFHILLAEHKTDAITIRGCMGTIMGVSKTTACLPLSLLNDAGYMAFCESDFAVIPSGILLRNICGKPVFLQDPTYAHDNIVTLAHCTAPRRMDGKNLEPVKILTHFESDYGAAPKVEMKLGQKVTVIDPDFNFKEWMAFEAEIIDNPFMDICRSQIDVQFKEDTDKLNEKTKGFHWMLCYGNYLKETEYAVRKSGIDWVEI